MEQLSIDSSKFQILIWGDSTNIQNFREETNCEKYPYHIVNPFIAIDVVNGEFPTYILTQDSQVVKGMNLRGMDEDMLLEHLTK